MLGTSIWALHMTWATSALLTLGLGGTVVLRGLLPAALAWTSRGLINAAVQASHGGAGAFRLLLHWLLLGFLVAVVEALSPLANKLVLQNWSDDLHLGLAS